MKFTFKEIYEANPILQKIFNTDSGEAKVNYALSKIAKKIQSEMEDITKGRETLIKKYGEEQVVKIKDPDGKEQEKKTGGWLVKMGTPKYQEFSDAIDKYLETETEDIAIWLIPFKACEVAKLIPNQYILIDKFIAEPEGEQDESKESPKATGDEPKQTPPSSVEKKI